MNSPESTRTLIKSFYTDKDQGLVIRFLTAIIIALTLSVFSVQTHADQFGRLFLSSKERATLERLRYAKPEPVQEVVVEEIIPEPDMTELMANEIEEAELPEIILEEEPVLTESLTLKGVVKRGNGKNVAWLNNSNTLTGDSVMPDVSIHESDISSDSARVHLPDNVTEVTLKVGQTYEPDALSENITDEK